MDKSSSPRRVDQGQAGTTAAVASEIPPIISHEESYFFCVGGSRWVEVKFWLWRLVICGMCAHMVTVWTALFVKSTPVTELMTYVKGSESCMSASKFIQDASVQKMQAERRSQKFLAQFSSRVSKLTPPCNGGSAKRLQDLDRDFAV